MRRRKRRTEEDNGMEKTRRRVHGGGEDNKTEKGERITTEREAKAAAAPRSNGPIWMNKSRERDKRESNNNKGVKTHTTLSTHTHKTHIRHTHQTQTTHQIHKHTSKHTQNTHHTSNIHNTSNTQNKLNKQLASGARRGRKGMSAVLLAFLRSLPGISEPRSSAPPAPPWCPCWSRPVP